MEIKEGQVWTYDNRASEPDSRAIILKVESMNDESLIIHIQVSGIQINNPNSNKMIEEITHMPFSVEAVGGSLVELVGTCDIPDYAEGYDAWKSEYDNGRAGVFSFSIGEAVKFMDENINR